jgi:hypothetical protein
MATSVKIETPIPTTDQVARRLGISGERKRAILDLAEETVERYYERSSKLDSRYRDRDGKLSGTSKPSSAKKQKAA